MMMVRKLGLLVMLGASAAMAQSNTFDLQAGGKTAGKDTYTLAKAKQGYKMSSRFTLHLGGAESDSAQNFKLDENYRFLDGDASNLANQSHISFSPNKARTELVVGMVQAGVQDSKHLPVKPNFVLLPAYDAGAAQVVLLQAITHPTEDNLYNVVVPAGSVSAAAAGSGAPSGPAGNFAYDALWTKSADATGKLDGKDVTLHSYVLKAGKETWTFYADDANTLMQVEVSMLKASYVRSHFILDAKQG